MRKNTLAIAAMITLIIGLGGFIFSAYAAPGFFRKANMTRQELGGPGWNGKNGAPGMMGRNFSERNAGPGRCWR